MKTTTQKGQTVTAVTPDNRGKIFTEAYNGSYFTVLGAGGPISDWTDGLTGMLAEEGMGEPKEFIVFSGKDMNRHYGLTGTNAYDGSLTCVMFPLDGIDTVKLAMFKMAIGARWFDDIVDNNARREEEKKAEAFACWA